MQGLLVFHPIEMKDKEPKKKASLLRALAFLQQFEIELRDPLQKVLRLSECAPTLLYLFLHLLGDGDLPNPPIPETHGKDPDRSVALSDGLPAKPATGFVAADHAA